MKKLLTAIVSLALASTSLFAQGTYVVKGVVVDQAGPVIGAAVMEKGTQNGAVTDFDGLYTLKASSADAIIEFTCIGYATLTFKASEVPETVTMKDDSQFLDEVVVIGYGTVKKGDMTGSVVAIKADDVNRGAVTSPDQMLLGKVSGLRIVPASGQPGASATIRIRGAASLNASNDPLIVIDGVPVTSDGGAGMGNPLGSVNPNDIESYSVLKDASAAAIYGSRASNGVIIITTKKGVGSKPQVSYDGSFSIKQNVRTLDMMSGDEFRAYMNEHYSGNAAKIALLGDANTDWQSQIYRLAAQTDHNVSVRGGGKFPFRVSMGYNLDQATLKTGDNQKGNLDMSLSPKFLDDHLSINANVKGIYQKTNWANGGAVGNALAFDPTKPVYLEDGKTPWNWYTDADKTVANTQSSVNPLSNLYDYTNWNKGLRTISNFQADYKVHGFEDLRFNVNVGIDVASTNGEKYNQIGSISSMREGTDLAYKYRNYNLNSLFEAYADYSHDFGWSNLDVMGGYSWQHNYVKYEEEQFYNKEDRWQEVDRYQEVPSNAKEYYLISFFGRVNYSLFGKHLFTFTLRDDASSRFSKKNRWGLFPSLAYAYNIAEEDFLKGGPVSQLKLRLGWGQTGQQDIGSDYYPYLARYVEGSNVAMRYNMGGSMATTLAPLAYNPNLKWETTTTWNVGLDFGIFGDKLTGSAEAYLRNTTDLLNRIDAPLGSNFSNKVTSNIGSMMNRGLEFSLNYNIIETKDMHWSVGANVTFQETKITKLTAVHDDNYLGVTTGSKLSGTDGYSSLFREGCAPYTYYLFEQFYLNGEPVQNGLIDRTPDGEITSNDRYITGLSPEPSAFYGFNTHFSWKKWDFSMNGHGSVGNYLINKVALGYSTSYADDASRGYLNNLSNQYLIKGWDAAMNTEQFYSDMFIENASFLKIDDINLGYRFDLRDSWAKNIRVAGSIQNVLTLTKYTGIDPEISNADGVDDNIIPRPRLYTIRVNIAF